MTLLLRRRFWLALFLTVGLFLVYSAVGERGLIRLHAMVGQRDALRSRVRTLEKSNNSLAEEIRLLRDDPATIEYLARTELGMVRQGETVYVLSDRPEEQAK